MPRKDVLHDAAKNALTKDGWTITHDPYSLKFDGQDVHIDLAAEMPIAAEKEGRRIAVEVKSFLSKSPVTELERGIGQYILYRNLVFDIEPERKLYLAVSEEIFRTFLDKSVSRRILEKEHIFLLVFDVEQEEV